MAGYSNNNGASSSKLRDAGNYPHLTSLGGDDSSLVDDCIASLRQAGRSLLEFLRTSGKEAAWDALRLATHQLRRNLRPRRLFSFPHALVLVWVLVLLWGEHWVFHTTVERCGWDNWEKWVRPSVSGRLVFSRD